MNPTESRAKFIEGWGDLASRWGMCKTLGHIHALMLISSEPICITDISNQLDISKACVVSHMKTLLEWELAHKAKKQGRSEYCYTAIKDGWEILRLIIVHRKKKELDPMLALLDELQQDETLVTEEPELHLISQEFQGLATKVDKSLNRLCGFKQNILAGFLFS